MENSLQIPAGYKELLKELTARIRSAQLRASFAVSRELVLLYWSVGREILVRQQAQGWGAKVIEKLAHDLQIEFPGVEGYSPRSLKYMRSFAEAWPDEQIVQQVAALLPWGHHMVLLDRIKDPGFRGWYLRAAVEYGWSRNVLVLQIKSGLHGREGKALTNFQRVLPPPDSDLAEQILKDPYNFDFLTVREKAHEREVERGLLAHLRDLLLELGKGFAFIGSQVPVEVDGQTFYIDLLFYHVRLHCYFVIELKTGVFQPEWAGKLSFYLSAVDHLVRSSQDGRTVGLLLCESHRSTIVEYTLQNIDRPIGVSSYRVTRELPAPIRDQVPTVEDLQEVIGKLREEIDDLRRDHEPSV